MKSPRLHSTLLFTVVLFSLYLVAAPSATAQWGVQSDQSVNRAVCDTTASNGAIQMGSPQTVSDGKNGAIIVWQDQRDGGFGIYAQHLDSNGKEMWKHNGVNLVNSPTFNQSAPIMCTDDSGGAYVVWTDGRFSNSGGLFGLAYFAQHIRNNGTLMYADTGLPVAIGNNDRQNAVITDDGRGGAYVAWEDNRSNVTSTNPDIYMNHLWPGGVKFGDARGTTGVVLDTKVFHAPDVWSFYDNTAHFKPDLIGMQLMIKINGVYTKYQIAKVIDDTTLNLSKYPIAGTSYTWYVDGPVGLPIDTSKNKQMHPSICSDSVGGCFIAWSSSATVPTSIYAKRVDSNGTQLWNPSPAPGFLVYQGLCGGCAVQPNSKMVSVRNDGRQLLLTWETTNVNSADTQDIWAARIRSNTATDTTQMWGSAISVTGDMNLNQTVPQIWSDDSAIVGTGNPKGVLVAFENTKFGSSDDQDVSMIRVTGTEAQKPGNGLTYNFATQPHGQVNFQAVKVDSGLIGVWNDARYAGTGTGPDTCIYAQRLDKYGNAYLPSFHAYTGSGYYKIAKPICVGQRADGSWWTAKQPAICPRTNGAIIVWTDYRKGTGTPGIYSQLVWKDASLPIELASFDAVCRYRGQVDIAWKTASEQENAGFEIERRTIESSSNTDFATVASYTDESALRGAGTSNIERNYGWTDRGVEPAVYEYRLVEVALDGNRLAHDPKRVDARYGWSVDSWSLGPNQPNPFADRTVLPLSLPSSAVVDLTIFDVTGRIVATPVSHQVLAGGVHEIVLDRNMLGTASGGLMARVVAYDPASGAVLWQSEKPVMMTVLH